MTILETAYRIATQHPLEGECAPFQEFKHYLDSRVEREQFENKYRKRGANSLTVFVLSLCAILLLIALAPDPYAQPVLSRVVHVTVFILSWVVTPGSLIMMIWNHAKSRRYGPVRRHDEMLERLNGFMSSFYRVTGMGFNWSFDVEPIQEEFTGFAQAVHDGTADYGSLFYRGPKRGTTIDDMNKVGRHFGFYFDPTKAQVPVEQTSQPHAT